MSSSTSNSDRPHWRILFSIGVLLLFLMVAEVFNRVIVLPRSTDFLRFLYYPARVEKLMSRSGLHIAFVGNSATEFGVDPDVVEARLVSQTGQAVAADRFVADSAEIHTWYYMCKNLFWKQKQSPDWVVIHFFGPSLNDACNIQIGRLSYVIACPEDRVEVLREDLPTMQSRADFLLSLHWSTYATRNRFKNRILSSFVPNYENYRNERLRFDRKASGAPPTTSTLERFLAKAKANDMKVCFVAFPTLTDREDQTYDVDPNVIRLIGEAGMEFLDLRSIPLLPEHRRDDMHLLPEGAKIYSRHFSDAFATILSRHK